MEEKRLIASPEDIKACFHRLVGLVDGFSAHFIFHFDEMGHELWADRSEKTCHVPSQYPDDEIAFPVPRTDKRTTLVAYIGEFF
jgi:hypothetical protein